jgi:hypothetical protein
MSNSFAIATNKRELEEALKNKIDKIIVTDPDLARNIRTVKFASKASLVAAIAGVGVAATNFWNPVGWSVGLVSEVAGGSITVAIIALGLGAALVIVIYNDYNITAKGKVKMPNGTEVEGEVILERS